MIKDGKRCPKLTAVIVGQDPASQTYVKNKMIAAKFTGIESETITLPESTSQDELLQKIEELNNSPDVDGIIVQVCMIDYYKLIQ